MLLELGHGKLVNFRSDQVEHEFVNCAVTTAKRKVFDITYHNWGQGIGFANSFTDTVLDLIHDWGAGLEAPLYAEAIGHKFGGAAVVEHDIDVVFEGHRIGSHHVHLLSPRTAFKITAIPNNWTNYESHLKKLLRYTSLDTVLWANVALGKVAFHEVSR